MSTNSLVPSSITAWQYTRRGLLPATLCKTDTAKLPELQPDQVLIKVHAAALNPVDWKVAASVPGFLQKFPKTASSDFAGDVVAVKPGSETARKPWLQPGARVYGFVHPDKGFKTGLGSLATYTVADANVVAPIPASMSYEDAAGLTLVGLTAEVLASKVKKGDKVLILGASSAVGLVLTQMCKAHGAAKVVATASGEKCQIVKERGVDEAIDYRATDADKELRHLHGSEPFDVVLDCVGSMSTYFASPGFLKPGGVYYNVGASALDGGNLLSSALHFLRDVVRALYWPRWLGGTPRKYVMALTEIQFMDRLQAHVERGEVTPKVEWVFAFDEARKAYEHLLKGRSVGKVVVKVRND
ncbi:hypothetical protein ACQY0O_000966 [Thecaphora frezii]